MQVVDKKTSRVHTKVTHPVSPHNSPIIQVIDANVIVQEGNNPETPILIGEDTPVILSEELDFIEDQNTESHSSEVNSDSYNTDDDLEETAARELIGTKGGSKATVCFFFYSNNRLYFLISQTSNTREENNRPLLVC